MSELSGNGHQAFLKERARPAAMRDRPPPRGGGSLPRRRGSSCPPSPRSGRTMSASAANLASPPPAPQTCLVSRNPLFCRGLDFSSGQRNLPFPRPGGSGRGDCPSHCRVLSSLTRCPCLSARSKAHPQAKNSWETNTRQESGLSAPRLGGDQGDGVTKPR